MSGLEAKDGATVVAVEDAAAFRNFQVATSKGLLMVAEPYGESKELTLLPLVGDFGKWLKLNAPEVPIAISSSENRLVLRSDEFWLPLVFLASDVSVSFYLDLAANYVYDKLKGALKGEKHRISLSAVYEDSANGVVKRFDFRGDVDALRQVAKRFDLNRFLDD